VVQREGSGDDGGTHIQRGFSVVRPPGGGEGGGGGNAPVGTKDVPIGMQPLRRLPFLSRKVIVMGLLPCLLYRYTYEHLYI
jgi:hypothetical protein